MGAIINVNHWKYYFVAALNIDVKKAIDRAQKDAMDAMDAITKLRLIDGDPEPWDRKTDMDCLILRVTNFLNNPYPLASTRFLLPPNDEKEIRIQFRKAIADRIVKETDLEVLFRKNVLEGVLNGGYIDFFKPKWKGLRCCFPERYIMLLKEQCRFWIKVENFSPEEIKAAKQDLPESLRDSFPFDDMTYNCYYPENKLRLAEFWKDENVPVPHELINYCRQVEKTENWVSSYFLQAVFGGEDKICGDVRGFEQRIGTTQQIMEKIRAVGLQDLPESLRDSFPFDDMTYNCYYPENKLQLAEFWKDENVPVPHELINYCRQVEKTENWVSSYFLQAVFGGEDKICGDVRGFEQRIGTTQQIMEKIRAVGLADIHQHLIKNMAKLQEIKDQIVLLTGDEKSEA